MLDFNEIGRRIEQRNHQATCDGCASQGVLSHLDIVAPLIGQLLDPEYHGEKGTVLVTANECINLGHLVERQAQLLDQREAMLEQMQEGSMPLPSAMAAIEAMSKRIAYLQRKLQIITLGTVVVALWLSSIVVSVWLSH